MRSPLVLLLWLITIAVSIAAIIRVPFLTDMSIFLPRSPNSEQSVLVQGVSSGASARSLLISVSGVPAKKRAEVSGLLANQWQSLSTVQTVMNGRVSGLQADEKLVFGSRYLLSPGVSKEAFAEQSLHQAIARTVRLLTSSVGMFAKDQLLMDPTGEALRVIEAVTPATRPRTDKGVWVSQNGEDLLFLIQSTVAGTDLDGQQALHQAIAKGLASVRDKAALPVMDLAISGTSVFAVTSREMIRGDVMRLSTVGVGLIVLLLAFVFRSARAVLLTLVPMLSAVIAGAAAVSTVFGTLHGLTLGFGAALIGETVDYAIYHLASNSNAPRGAGVSAAAQHEYQRQFWAPVRLGLVTSIAGFAVLLLSGFPGLAQMAVFSIAGLAMGFAVARWILPVLTPANFEPRSLNGIGNLLHRLMNANKHARVPIVLVAIAAIAFCAYHRDRLWDNDITSLNPAAKSAQQMDYQLRQALGEQGMRMMVLIKAKDESTLLEATEAVSLEMRAQVKAGTIVGFSSPTDILPAPSTQQVRQAALPDENALRLALLRATAGLPLKPKIFDAFVNDVQSARTRALLTMADFDGTQLGTRLNTLILRQPDGLTAMLPIGEPPDGNVDLDILRTALPVPAGSTVTVVDMKAETNAMYSGYMREAITLSLIGALVIAALLWFRLGTLAKVAQVSAPVLVALLIVISMLLTNGKSMHLLHLVGLLLVAAVGSNYALVIGDFHDSARSDTATLGSLCVANATTLCGYGVLAASSIPLLSALGTTVGVGAPLVLLLSVLWIAPRHAQVAA